MLSRKTSDILNASNFYPKEKILLTFSASPGKRLAYIITKEMIEQLRETIMTLEEYSNMSWNLRPNTIKTKDRVWSKIVK